MFGKVSIIGVGLIGGSLARVIKSSAAADEIVGFGRTLEHLQQAVDLGVIDRAATDLGEAVRNADLVILALPVGAIKEVLYKIAGDLGERTVITDVGSTKLQVIREARESLKQLFPQFVPGHPIAGTERSGVEASFAGLFENNYTILTPVEETRNTALSRVKNLWQLANAQVVEMDALVHDEVFAGCSHVPHVLAYALVDALVRNDRHKDVFKYAAGGFRDFTRIASSDPVLWRDICLTNAKPISELLRQYQSDLGTLIDAIEAGNGRVLLEIFQRAKGARDRYTELNQES